MTLSRVRIFEKEQNEKRGFANILVCKIFERGLTNILVCEYLRESKTGRWASQVGRLVAPFLDHWLLHLSWVDPGLDANLFGNLDAVRLQNQPWNKNSLHPAILLWFEAAILRRDVLDQVLLLLPANLLSRLEFTVGWGTNLPWYLTAGCLGVYFLHSLLLQGAPLDRPVLALLPKGKKALLLVLFVPSCLPPTPALLLSGKRKGHLNIPALPLGDHLTDRLVLLYLVLLEPCLTACLIVGATDF